MTRSVEETVSCAECKQDVPKGDSCPACGAGKRVHTEREPDVYTGVLTLDNGVQMHGRWVHSNDVRDLLYALKHARGCGLLSPQPDSMKRIDAAIAAAESLSDEDGVKS